MARHSIDREYPTELLVVRHGRAVDADTFAATGKPDDDRPLTDAGVAEMEQIAAALRGLIQRADLVATSPLVRARQTAAIVARAYGMEVGATIDELRPGSSFESFLEWAHSRSGHGIIGIVGHSPHLNRLILWLMSGVDREGVALKKGGACLLGFDRTLDRGAAVMQWLLTPAQICHAESDGVQTLL